MHRNSDDRKREKRGAHAGKMRSHAGARNNDFDAPLFGALRPFEKDIRLSVRRNNVHFVIDAEGIQNFRRLAHHRHIRIRTHNNANRCHNLPPAA